MFMTWFGGVGLRITNGIGGGLNSTIGTCESEIYFRSNRIANRIGGYDANSNRLSNRIRM